MGKDAKEKKSPAEQLFAHIRRGWKPTDCASHIQKTRGTCRLTILGDYEAEKGSRSKPTHNLMKKARLELTEAWFAEHGFRACSGKK